MIIIPVIIPLGVVRTGVKPLIVVPIVVQKTAGVVPVPKIRKIILI